MSTIEQLPALLTTIQLRSVISVHRNTMMKLIADGEFPNAFTIGTKWRIPREDLAAYIERRKAAGRKWSSKTLATTKPAAATDEDSDLDAPLTRQKTADEKIAEEHFAARKGKSKRGRNRPAAAAERHDSVLNSTDLPGVDDYQQFHKPLRIAD